MHQKPIKNMPQFYGQFEQKMFVSIGPWDAPDRASDGSGRTFNTSENGPMPREVKAATYKQKKFTFSKNWKWHHVGPVPYNFFALRYCYVIYGKILEIIFHINW